MHHLKTLLITIAILLLLTGCMTTRLEQPLAKNTRIGVLSDLDQKAEFQFIGTTLFQNDEYQHTLPNFNPNRVATDEAANILRNKGYTVIAIDSSNDPETKKPAKYKPLLGSNKERFVNNGVARPEVGKGKYSYLRKLADKYNVDTLLLIEDSPVNFGYDLGNTEYYFESYGILTRSFLGMHKTYLGIGYRVSLIRLNDFAVLATQSDSATKKEDKDLWKDKFEQIPANDLNYIEQSLKTLLTQSLKANIYKALSLN